MYCNVCNCNLCDLHPRHTSSADCLVINNQNKNLQFYSNNFGLKQLSSTSKTFHYYGTGVSSRFKVIKNCMRCYMHSLVTSPYSRDFL